MRRVSSKNRSQRSSIQTPYSWRLRPARFRKQSIFTLSTCSGGLQITHGGSRRKCSVKGKIFPRQTSMSTLLVVPVSVSFRCSCSECQHLIYKLSYPTSKMTRARFRKEVATPLMRNPAGSIRKRPYDFSNSNPSISPSFSSGTSLEIPFYKVLLHPVQ